MAPLRDAWKKLKVTEFFRKVHNYVMKIFPYFMIGFAIGIVIGFLSATWHILTKEDTSNRQPPTLSSYSRLG